MAEATGWAVVSNRGTVYVKTVSDTRRAAIINYLVAEQHLRIMNWETDGDIEQRWRAFGQYAEVHEVFITTKPVLSSQMPDRS